MENTKVTRVDKRDVEVGIDYGNTPGSRRLGKLPLSRVGRKSRAYRRMIALLQEASRQGIPATKAKMAELRAKALAGNRYKVGKPPGGVVSQPLTDLCPLCNKRRTTAFNEPCRRCVELEMAKGRTVITQITKGDSQL